MAAPWGDAARVQRRGGLSRRTRAGLVAVEAVIGAVVGGVAVGGMIGWTVAGSAGVVFVVVVLAWSGAWARRRRSGPVAGDAAALLARLRVVGVASRSSGEVGVIGDGHGFAAGIEIDVKKGTILDVDAMCRLVAADPSRPAAVQVRVTSYAPPPGGWHPSAPPPRRRAAAVAGHRRLHVMLRLEPTLARDVVERHGGGAQGSRAALVAAVDRLSACLRRQGILSRVLDTRMLNDLLAEDAAAQLPAQLLAADPGSAADFDRLSGLLALAAPERAVLSLCVDFANGDEWRSFAAILVAARDPRQRADSAATLMADPAVRNLAGAAAIAAVLPLGGGPGDLVSVLTLARV